MRGVVEIKDEGLGANGISRYPYEPGQQSRQTDDAGNPLQAGAAAGN